jgi:toxin secretion/phage lysis holin
MTVLWHSFQAALIACGGLVGSFFGEQDGSIYVLIAFVVADYVTGVMNAIVKKKLSSAVGAKGIFKKMMIFILIVIMHLVDKYLLGNGTALRTALTFFYVSNEGISILENATELGLPVPKAIKDILAQLKKKMVNESEKIETIIGGEEDAEDEPEKVVSD